VPNLQPDTSIYANVGKSQGQMSPLDLMALITRMKEYQSQQNETQALQNAPQTDSPTGPVVDYTAARRSILQNPTGGFVHSDQLTALEQLAQEQQNTQQKKTDGILRIITPLLDLPKSQIPKAFAGMVPALVAIGANPEMVATQFLGIDPETAKRNLALYKQQQIGPTGQEPMTNVPGPGGAPVAQPSSATALQARGVGNAAFPGVPTTGGPGEEPYWNDLKLAGDYTRDIQPLVQAIPAISKLGPRSFGPGTDELNYVKKFLTVGGADKMLGINVEDINNYDKAKKAIADWNNRISAGGTNDRLAQTIESNPNTTMLKSTMMTILKTNLAVRAMKQAQIREFQKSGLPPNQYPDWAAKWNQDQDPRAFALPMMSKDAAQKMLKGMGSLNSPERLRFEVSHGIAAAYPVPAPTGGWNIPEDEEAPKRPRAQPQAPTAESGGNL
jgi:hypothetical protein